jgi:hypothetical protein
MLTPVVKDRFIKLFVPFVWKSIDEVKLCVSHVDAPRAKNVAGL